MAAIIIKEIKNELKGQVRLKKPKQTPRRDLTDK
jgi:hypothetical protein